ncbi:phosphosulfolactate phosphohydrolase-like enzyme [Thermobacillus composti KWC4]|uniref:Probable 2-phosphosulfolactate phosphatase n=1 Tax=Thermobacillus composti (strain DSM 18247 / JCM 13945 / KWC4) TaxID=717605 RepID=L0EH71_THECK|nr:2-phosphosulfolactate phosphatase [Thermobacillus composti]AGA59142.1 phosphosulfolactate phosphohydrolase-like enzyme [Thermobacillus composti KWC4]
MSWFDQSPYEIKVEWGERGAREAANRGDIVIIVDVLSFSSTVVTAVEHGAEIWPFRPPVDEEAKAYAERLRAELVLGRAEAQRFGGHSLSPLSFTPADHGRRYVLCSLNGASCVRMAERVPALLVGSLLNASAVAAAANRLKRELNANITVVPCGEKWPDARENENRLRPGIEDYLGAGMILSRLEGSKSPEAEVCIGAYEASGTKLAELVWDSASGRELREKGFEQDVLYCARTDICSVVPVLRGGRFADANGEAGG